MEPTMVFLSEMIGMVEEYTHIRKGERVKIKPTDTDLELQKLGYAYDYATNWLKQNGYSII